MENKNQSREQRPAEWVSYFDDLNNSPMFVLRENGQTVDLQIPGTETVIESVSKKLLCPVAELFELNGRYGMANVAYKKRQDDGSYIPVPPIEPKPGYIMATIAFGPVLIVSLNADKISYEAEDMDGNPLLRPLGRSEIRKLPKEVGEKLRKTHEKRITEVVASQPMDEGRFKWGSRGYTQKKSINGRDTYYCPTVRMGEIHVHAEIGACVVLSTKSGFDGESWARVRKIGFIDEQVVLGEEVNVRIMERRENRSGSSFLFAHFRWTNEEFRNQLERVPEIAELLKKIRPAPKPVKIEQKPAVQATQKK